MRTECDIVVVIQGAYARDYSRRRQQGGGDRNAADTAPAGTRIQNTKSTPMARLDILHLRPCKHCTIYEAG